jgi:hypothetical protein
MEGYFRSSAPSCSWVAKQLRALKRDEDIFEPCERPGRLQDPLSGLRVLKFLNSTPFMSIRQIATAIKIPRSAVLDHVKGWSSTVRYLKWVSHHLTTAMMEQRVDRSRELFATLRSAKRRGCTQFLTGDESWFWLTIDYEQEWLPPRAERPT